MREQVCDQSECCNNAERPPCHPKKSSPILTHAAGTMSRTNDRFTQWFGSCSLMSTLYVWFPASWAPMVAERLFSWSPHQGFAYPQHGRPVSGPPQTTSRVHPWHQHSQGAAGSSEAMEETDSTDVKYKIRQWSLPGATIVPVLNVSSRVFWLELDDKALLDSYAVLQEGILCDVFSQKCSAAWQGARGERLTVGIMLPGRQDADDWLNFMLSQKNLWPTFTTRGTLTEEISEQVYSKERAGCRPSICGWWSSYGGGCLLTECTSKPPPGSPKKNWMLCSSTGPPDATAQTHMKRKSIVGLESKKSRHGGRNARIGWHTLKNKVNRLSLTSRSC